MDDLIRRLEGATEGSRELDGEIALSQGWTFQKMKGDSRPYWRKPGVTQYFSRSDKPLYTVSLDCALTLVPEHMLWEITRGIGCRAIVWSMEVDYDDRNPPCGDHCDSPALALCIAALRARSNARRDVA